MVEPSCSTRCSSYVLHRIRSWFHLPYIQAFSKLKFLLSCGASRGKVESLPRTRRGILVSHRHHSSFSKFPTWHRYRLRPQEVLIQFTMHRLRSFFTFPHVTSKCFECCCCQRVFFAFRPKHHISFCPIFVHPLFPVFEPHIQKWVIFGRRRPCVCDTFSFESLPPPRGKDRFWHRLPPPPPPRTTTIELPECPTRGKNKKVRVFLRRRRRPG